MKDNTIFALTGNMGCGKSTVGGFLAEYNDVATFDCDRLAKEIMLRKENWPRILMILGPSIFFSGIPDMKKVSQMIFESPAKKKKLENFLYPLVWKEIQKLIGENNDKKIFIVESALIYEAEWEKYFDAVIVAVCSEKTQMSRLIENRSLTEEKIKERLRFQLPQKEKIGRAQFVINTDCTLETLKEKTNELRKKLKNYVSKENMS